MVEASVAFFFLTFLDREHGCVAFVLEVLISLYCTLDIGT